MTIPTIDESVIKRFWDKVEKRKDKITIVNHFKKIELGCWEWDASRCGSGYGYFKIGNRTYRSHRVSWMMHYGEIPKDRLICHTCDNPQCVRIDHLWLGTPRMNIRDAILKNKKIGNPFKINPDQYPLLFKEYESGVLVNKLRKRYDFKNEPCLNYLLGRVDRERFIKAKVLRNEAIKKELSSSKVRKSIDP